MPSSPSELGEALQPDLCNKLGNLLNRTLKMLAQYRERRRAGRGRRADGGRSVATVAREAVQDVERAMPALDPAAALATIERLVNAGNEDIDTSAPWKRHKEGDAQAVADALYTALEALRIVSVLLAPFLPHVARRIREQLGLTTRRAGRTPPQWGRLPAGTKTQEAQPIFPRIDTKKQRQRPTRPRRPRSP